MKIINKKIFTGIIAILFLVLAVGCGCSQTKEFTVTFNSNGGSDIPNQIVKENEDVTKPVDPTRENYTFDGWYLNEEEFNFDSKIIQDITLTAKWTLNATGETYTVKFDSNGGSAVEKQLVSKNELAIEPTTPVKEGYTFDKWLLNSKEYNFESKVTKDITLKASWKKVSAGEEKETYTVKFDSNGGSNINNKLVISGNTVAKPANPTRSGYTFSGWTLNNKTYDFKTKVTSNITLVANWTKNEEKTTPEVVNYKVTFNSNGGSSISSQTVKSGATATKPANPTRSGYTFAGWTLNGNNYDFATKVTGNITLTAKWTEVAKTYTVELVSRGLGNPSYNLVVKENGTNITNTGRISGIIIAGETFKVTDAVPGGLVSNISSVTVTFNDGTGSKTATLVK